MTDLTTIIQTIDHIFTTVIFIPMLFILYCRVTSFQKKSRRTYQAYRICVVLAVLFLLRYFCAKFIFTEVNYPRIAESGLFPLIRAVFYPDQP